MHTSQEVLLSSCFCHELIDIPLSFAEKSHDAPPQPQGYQLTPHDHFHDQRMNHYLGWDYQGLEQLAGQVYLLAVPPKTRYYWLSQNLLGH